MQIKPRFSTLYAKALKRSTALGSLFFALPIFGPKNTERLPLGGDNAEHIMDFLMSRRVDTTGQFFRG